MLMERIQQIEEAERKYPGPMEFAHLHAHSMFSPLDGIPEPEAYLKECAARGWNAMAITDHGSLAAVPDAYAAAKEHKIKYIVGIEAYYNDNHLKLMELRAKGISIGNIKSVDKELRDEMVRNRHITILAKNQVGYKNLIKMMTEAYEIGNYYKPRIWFDRIVQHREGLIVFSGCLNGPVCHNIRKGRRSIAIDYVRRFRDALGEDFYVEMQMPGPELKDGIPTFQRLNFIAKNMGVKTVLTNDTHYLRREDFQVQKLLMAIDQKLKVDDPNLFHVNSDEQFLKTRAELRQTFKEQGYAVGNAVSSADFETACDGTLEVAQKCETFSPDTSLKLPEIPQADEELTRLTLVGLKRIQKHEDAIYAERAKFELRMIIEKRFSSYFLITRDLIEHSKKIGFDVGPGRGSVGGSLVAYLIGITTIDPIKFKLTFERFISPSRGGNLLNIKMD